MPMAVTFTTALSGAKPPLGQLLTTSLLLGFCLSFTASVLTNRYQPMDMGTLFLLLLPLAWIMRTPNTVRIDRSAAYFLLIAFLIIVWLTATQSFSSFAVPSGWFRTAERGCALCACLFLIARTLNVGDLICHAGAAAALSAFIVLIFNFKLGLLEPRNVVCYGFGHVNIFTNTVGPSLLAWFIYVVLETRNGKRFRFSEYLLLIIGLFSLFTIALVTHRRGIVLSYTLVCAWFVWLWAWRHFRLPTLIITTGLLSSGVIALLYRLQGPTLLYGSDERLALYRSAIDGIRDNFPWGYGSYGAIRLHDCAGEAARHMTAAGGWGTHIHNEFLDIGLDGGIFAIIGLILLISIMGYRLLKIENASHRWALQALGIAILLHLITDNCYGTTIGIIWLGMVAGIMLSAPCTAHYPAQQPWNIPLRFMMWPAALASLWGATHAIYPAVLHRESYPSVRISALNQAYEPMTLSCMGNTLLYDDNVENIINQPTRGTIIKELQSKMGSYGTIDILSLEATANTLSIPERVQRLAKIIHHFPFNKKIYLVLSVHLREAPDQAALIDPQIVQRVAWLEGNRKVTPAINLAHRPTTIDEAANLYAATIWTLSVGAPWKDVRQALFNLLTWYGDVEDVSELAFTALCQAPPHTFPELYAMHHVFSIGLKTPALLSALHDISDPHQADYLIHLLWRMYPLIKSDCLTGSSDNLRDTRDATIDHRVAVMKLWGLSRHSK